MLIPLSLDHARIAQETRSPRASFSASGIRAAAKYCSTHIGALLYGSGEARPSHALAAFRKAKPATTAVASARKIIWVRPEDIIYKICSDHTLRADAILAGDWDLDRVPLTASVKYQSIVKHFKDGVAWEDTALFDDYAARFGRGEIVRGASSLERLKRQYETRVEAVFKDLGTTGFRIARDLLGRPTNLPHVHIGRDGEILYGTKGNHRLAMAKLLSLSVIPCHVRARHADWQKVREEVLAAVLLTEDSAAPPNGRATLMDHPDLADLYFPSR
jgi:hypothetical protein